MKWYKKVWMNCLSVILVLLCVRVCVGGGGVRLNLNALIKLCKEKMTSAQVRTFDDGENQWFNLAPTIQAQQT